MTTPAHLPLARVEPETLPVAAAESRTVTPLLVGNIIKFNQAFSDIKVEAFNFDLGLFDGTTY